MQHHHPGSWFMPWGVPLQKMLVTIPHHPQAGPVYHPHHTVDGSVPGQTQMPSPVMPSAAMVQQPPPPTPTGQNTHSPPNGAYHLQGHRQGHYQALHNPMHHHHQHPHAQQIHPHAAAMFTPISLRSFLGHQTHNMGALSQAQPPANSPLGNASMPVGQMPTMSLNVGVIPMQGGAGAGVGGAGGRVMGQTGGLPSPGCGIGLTQHTSPTATGASLLMPMKKVKKK